LEGKGRAELECAISDGSDGKTGQSDKSAAVLVAAPLGWYTARCNTTITTAQWGLELEVKAAW
jgi:hypothetical protein